MVEVNIHKKISTVTDVLQVNTSFMSGANTQIFGPSGSGKTTLLKILAGLAVPEQGLITVDGQVWLDTARKISLPVQKRNLGFVFQDYALFPNMTVAQHLSYGSNEVSYIQHLLEMGKMKGLEKHKPRQLSGGQQQRLAILRALSTKPKLLLMDEPFSALDKALKQELIADLRTLLKTLGATCLVVTHQPLEEGTFADFSFEIDA